MLETVFMYPRVLARMRCGPLGKSIDALADEFVRTGYDRATVRRYLSLVATFSRYAHRAGCTRVEDIDRALVGRFLRRGTWSTGTRSLARTALGHALPHVFRPAPDALPGTPQDDADAALVAAFDTYLTAVRGLQPRSRTEVRRLAERFLQWFHTHRPRQPLTALTGADVLAFVAALVAQPIAIVTRSKWVAHFRTLLRYLEGQAVVDDNLARIVPWVSAYSLAHLPQHLAWSEVREVIDAIDPTEPTGRRDRALLLLLATTGLRNQEVRRLELGDIRWRTGEVHIRQTKSRRERVVPLLEEAGKALADYVLHGRPQGHGSQLFLRQVPPVGPLAQSGALAAIVRRRLARCGLHPTRAGAHLLRHSLATRLVEQQRPIKEVADLLGHRRIDTTAIYVKVAVSQLERVALPFPGGAP